MTKCDILSVMIAKFVWRDALTHSHPQYFEDNQAANFALLKGFSADFNASLLPGLFWGAAATRLAATMDAHCREIAAEAAALAPATAEPKLIAALGRFLFGCAAVGSACGIVSLLRLDLFFEFEDARGEVKVKVASSPADSRAEAMAVRA